MKKAIILITAFLFAMQLSAQQLLQQDYTRAVSFISSNLFNKRVFNINPQFSWFTDSSGVSFITQSATQKLFNKLDWKKMKLEPLFDHNRLAALLSDSLKKEIRSTDLPLTSIRYDGRAIVEFTIEGKEYTLNITTYTLAHKKTEQQNPLEEKSPDGKWIAYNKGYNLFIKSTATGETKQLSTAGMKNYEYASWYGWGEIIEGENGERPNHFAVNWSPDSKWIQTYICDLRKGQKMYLLDWSVDTLYKPKLLSYYRGSPGDTDMVYMIPVLFNIQTGEEIEKDEFRNVNTTDFEWTKEPGLIYIENRQRGYQKTELFLYDCNTKKQDLLYTESSHTNIDNYRSLATADPDKIIITSEKDGWKQLYLLNTKNRLVSPITNGSYYVNEILHVDDKTKTIFFTASGREPGRNPYYQHFYKIKMDGTGLILLTPENTNHDISISPNGQYFTDNMSTLNEPTRSVLRDSKTGKQLLELAKADIDALMAMHFPMPAIIYRDSKRRKNHYLWCALEAGWF